MKILVTGSNGYIGSKIVSKLCDIGIDVIATDLVNTHIDERAKFIKSNIFDNNANWMEYFENPDVCLHMAWRDGFIHNSNKHMDDLSGHYLFLTNLIENGLKQVTVMGSMHEIGYWEGKIDENTYCNPLSMYGISKNALRQSIELFCKNHDCIFQWIRGYYIFGNDEFGNSIFCKIRQAAKEGKKLFPFTTGKNKYDFININDLVDQISNVVIQNRINGIINCCSGTPVSLADEVEWYIRKNNLQIKLDYGKYPDRPYDSPCVYGDNSKIKSIIAYNKLKSKTILVTGCNGQLGFDCVKKLKEIGCSLVYGIDKKDVDISNKNDITKYILNLKPDIIIHCAAWTQVDKAEEQPNLVFSINSEGTKFIAEAAQTVGAKLVYISTDYVFSGIGTKPFEIDDEKCPLSIYGKSKLEGENNVIKYCNKYFIIRISWAFGTNGNNFVETMKKIAMAGKKEIDVVNDQIGSVTYTKDLANLIVDMVQTDKYGMYHATNEGFISWYEFAIEIFKKLKFKMKINPISTEEYLKKVPNQARRPLNSRLSKKSLIQNGFSLLPDWKDALTRYLEEN